MADPRFLNPSIDELLQMLHAEALERALEMWRSYTPKSEVEKIMEHFTIPTMEEE